MATVTVYAPNPNYSSNGTGYALIAGVEFKDGKATVDRSNRSALAYFRRHGYGIDEPAATPAVEESPDPRDVTKQQAGTKLRDAAVDPRPGDFLPPTNAGEANPHGPEVIAPEIHAAEAGAKPIVAGPVSSDADVQQAKETVAATVAVTDGPGDAATVEPRPNRSANKEAWLAYAAAHGYDESEGLTRDQLIDRYGKES